MAINGNFQTNAYEVRSLQFEWSIAQQNVTTNQTVINWTLKGAGGSPSLWYMTGNFKVVIEGATVYQSESRIQLRGTTVVASGQHTLTHHSDGTKSFSASCEAGIYYYAVNSRGSGTWELPRIARATQPTVNKTTLAFGEELVISCPRASNDFTHTIRGSVEGKLQPSIIASHVATSHTWTIPKSWARYLRSASDKLRIQVTTHHNGQEIGVKDVSSLITVTPTVEMKPQVFLSLSDPKGHLQTYGGFVKGQSTIQAEVTERLYEQASVQSRSLILNGITYQSSRETSAVITGTTQTVTASVTDTRGMTGTESITPKIYDWHAPKITTARVSRCQQNGTLDETGGYLKLEYACVIASVNNKNKRVLAYSYRVQNEVRNTRVTIDMSTYTKSGHVIFPASTEQSFEVTLELTDSFTTTRVILDAPTAFVLLDFHESGKGIGIGKVSEEALLLDIADNWVIGYRGGVIRDFIDSQGTMLGWHWRKWINGTMECWQRKQITVNVTHTWGSLFTSGPIAESLLTYPYAFVSPPVLNVNLSTHGVHAGFLMAGSSQPSSATKTGVYEVVRGVSASNVTIILNYYAIGRWKS